MAEARVTAGPRQGRGDEAVERNGNDDGIKIIAVAAADTQSHTVAGNMGNTQSDHNNKSESTDSNTNQRTLSTCSESGLWNVIETPGKEQDPVHSTTDQDTSSSSHSVVDGAVVASPSDILFGGVVEAADSDTHSDSGDTSPEVSGSIMSPGDILFLGGATVEETSTEDGENGDGFHGDDDGYHGDRESVDTMSSLCDLMSNVDLGGNRDAKDEPVEDVFVKADEGDDFSSPDVLILSDPPIGETSDSDAVTLEYHLSDMDAGTDTDSKLAASESEGGDYPRQSREGPSPPVTESREPKHDDNGEIGDTVSNSSDQPKDLTAQTVPRSPGGGTSVAKVVVMDAVGGEDVNAVFPVEGFGEQQVQAEARLAARRAARAEARDIRMREIERQQKEAEEKEKETPGGSNSKSSTGIRSYTIRQDSDDSVASGSSDDLRQIKKDLAEMEDKYKKSMMNSAQLDNEKQNYRYQVELLKDRLDDMEESHIELTREHKDRCRELEQKKRDHKDLQDEVEYLKAQLQQRDMLIEQYGLVFISNDTMDEEEDKKKGKKRRRKKKEEEAVTVALVTPDAATILAKQDGNLDDRIKHLSDQQSRLQKEVLSLRDQLDKEREKNEVAEKYANTRDTPRTTNGPDMSDLGKETQRELTEHKFKLKKAEQDITTLEGNVIRLESQVKRFRTASENAEKVEEELKQEKRRLQREVRDLRGVKEEQESLNEHLQRRIDKLKTGRSGRL